MSGSVDSASTCDASPIDARPVAAEARVPSSMVSIVVNGEALRLAPPCTVATLLEGRGLAGKRVAVERNGEIVPRSRHATTTLDDADRLEIVVAVGGG